MSAARFDVAIAGAGPAGSALALRLAWAGCTVALIERSALDGLRAGESLAPAVLPLLADLGVAGRFLELGALPSWGTRSIWGSDEEAVHSHLAHPYGSGWHVDRAALDRMLAEAAVAAGASLLSQTTIGRCRRRANDRWELDLCGPGPAMLEAEVAIDATGRTASLSRQLGGRSIVFDRLVGRMSLHRAARQVGGGFVSIVADPGGWWYAAPLPGGRMVTVRFSDADLLADRHAPASEPPGSIQVLLGSAAPDVPRVFSALSQRLRRGTERGRWLAVGDAALSVDPISGSGVVRALRTAASAASTTLDLLAGSERAVDETIARYEQELDRACLVYLAERSAYYRDERRWPGSPFWARRHATPPRGPISDDSVLLDAHA